MKLSEFAAAALALNRKPSELLAAAEQNRPGARKERPGRFAYGRSYAASSTGARSSNLE